MDMIIEPGLQTTKMPEIQGKNFWPRAGAYGIDFLILYGLSYIISWATGHILVRILFLVFSQTGKQFYVLEGPNNTTCGNYIIGFVQSIIYFAIFEWLFGRTPGKIILGMRVIGSNGDSLNLKQALIRSVYRLIDGLFLGIIAYVKMKAPGYQRLGDQKANTFVVSAKDTVIKENPAWEKFFLALILFILVDFMNIAIWLLAYIRFK